ncbi:hypothetical protein GOEFS_004_00030 [Gordonia effusa NBRC 100432]|uniref:DUF475 domain-containing protein n=1 Tax=Gordonia effusa NBRC 100432 TaxID=1077974 RepID=H0QUI7_9ACTN|nr:DUF475 domain-containing protein [Gordonia effusa]GAB16488.1 hypothetical protein GOEFS_004_00030 [Gordonia effusa NBRC 100432]
MAETQEHPTLFRTFGWSIGIAILGLAAGFWYGSTTGLAVVAILAVLEISLSFDNAVVNATILRRMSPYWQKIFLTVGILIAVFGMRLIFPLLVVGITAKLNPAEALRLAMEKGDPETPGTYGYLLNDAHPAIAAFGGMFLLMLFLGFVFDEKDINWLSWIERPLERIGKLDQLAVVIALAVLVISAYTLAPEHKISTVLLSGILGLITFLLVNGLGELFNIEEEDEEAELDAAAPTKGGNTQLAVATGKAAFFLFVYLEFIDASFSFDGVVGAFAITSDPIIIAIGLGVGAMFIRSLTVFLVRRGTLSEYVYLEHGAMWAIGALAVLLLITMRYEVPEVVVGLVGVGLIALSLMSSIIRRRRISALENTDDSNDGEPVATPTDHPDEPVSPAATKHL